MSSTYDAERMRILELVETGAITAGDGIRLINALSGENTSDKSPGDSLIPESLGTSTTPPADTDTTQGAASTRVSEDHTAFLKKWGRWWRYPFIAGVCLVIIGGLMLYLTYQPTSLGASFLFSWVLFMLGVAILALAWFSHSARWLHIRVHERSEEPPRRIALSFPLPLRFSAWILRYFGRWIPNLDRTSLDELILALNELNSLERPLYVEVEDDDEGDSVQVYIG